MEFDINIKVNLDGTLIIEDYSRDHGQYHPEDITQYFYGKYKYNDCVTIDILTKHQEDVDYKIHNHNQIVEDPTNDDVFIYDLEKTQFTVNKDGYYVLIHTIIPTTEWYSNWYMNSDDSDYKSSFNTIYVFDTTKKEVFKVKENGKDLSEWVSIDILDLKDVDFKNTSLFKCYIDIFYTGFLQRCYINYCKKLFKKLIKVENNTCLTDDDEQLIYSRDFLWMTLNIINYQISFKQYLEAERILDTVNFCGGFCKEINQYDRLTSSCGCT